MGGFTFGFRMILMVAFARIFYHCHYVGDTIMGAALGISVANTLNYVNVSAFAHFTAEQLVQTYDTLV